MGSKYKKQIINAINNKKIKEVLIIKKMFEEKNIIIDENDIIKVKKIYSSYKSTIKIYVNNKSINVSIVSDNNMIVFQERISLFINYLSSLSINKSILNYIYFFHWGDNTLNNTGKIRYSFNELKRKNMDKLQKINKSLNDKNILKKLIDYILFTDKNLTSPISYFLYFNNELKYISKEKLKNSLLENNVVIEDKIHIANMIINNQKRNINFVKEYECKRCYLIITFKDIIDYFERIVVEDKKC